jgi:hypothetical protein
MRKTLSLLALLFLLLFETRANAQSGCHAAFGYHHSMHSLTVLFTDASTSGHAITSWLWDFGDGHTSTDQHPSHTYAHHGVYTVCLTIHDVHGCTHTLCHHINVNGHFSDSHDHPVHHHHHHHARIQRGDNVQMNVKSDSQK